MSFGVSIGDFVALGNLALKVYETCKGAGEAFTEVTIEVLALHTVLEKLKKELHDANYIFGLLFENCTIVLNAIDTLLEKHMSLGTSKKWSLDRMMFGSGKLQGIRNQLTVYKSSLTLFVTILSTGSLERIEQKIDNLLAGTTVNNDVAAVQQDIRLDIWLGKLAEDEAMKAEFERHNQWVNQRLLERMKSDAQVHLPVNDKHDTPTDSIEFASTLSTLGRYELDSQNTSNPTSLDATRSTLQEAYKLPDPISSDTITTISSSLTSPGSQTNSPDCSDPTTLCTTHQAMNRISSNTTSEEWSNSTSLTRLSRISFESEATVSDTSIFFLNPLDQALSGRNKDAANASFIRMATNPEKHETKRLLKCITVEQKRRLLDRDSIHTALIGLARVNKHAKSHRLMAMESIIEECNPNLEYKDPECQRTPLIWAILCDNEAIVGLLLRKGASVEATDGHLLRKPLSWAVAKGSQKSMAILLRYRQAALLINAQEKDGRTALDLAISGNDSNLPSKLSRLYGAKPGRALAIPQCMELPG